MFLAFPSLPAQAAEPAAMPPIRAQYGWGYAAADGEGKGTLSLLMEPNSGKLVLEIHGMGERLVLLTGDRSGGYHILIPRQNVDETAPSLGALPLPFLPQVGSCEGLYRLLTQGEGPGVKVTRRDASGPVKLRYTGKDDKGREILVWLERTRWEVIPAAPAKP
jgi:hypothetical protein